MKIVSLLVVGLVGVSAAGFASDKGSGEGPWLVRLRALDLNPKNDSGAFSALNTNFPANAVSLSTKAFPEVDVSYFFTKYIAAELVLTYPQQHDVNLQGVGNIGTVTHLPPTLTVQYHYPIEKCPVTPYVGLGLNYTRITTTSLSVAGTGLDVTRNSLGLAYGGGLDYAINKKWSINLDFKHVDIHTNVKVKSSGAILTNLDVNPNLFSVGIGYRF